MADLPSILGGMAQGFLDFGKSAVDLFGTGGASIADLIESARTGKVTTKNSDDFRKWLYDTNDVKDAAAKGLGTALNGVQTVSDYIPGIGAVTRNPLFNAGQGALGGLADEFKMYGKDYDLGRAGQRAAVGAGGALASTGLADALKGSGNALLKSGTAQGLARGAVGGAIGAGGYTAIDGGSLGDVANSALQGAGMGAALGGTMGALQDFKPAKTYDVALTDEEKAARIANAKNMLANEQDPERIAELDNQIKSLGGGSDAEVNSPKLTPEQEAYFEDSVIRDENGNLIPMYHGTPDGSFTVFNEGSYFTPNKEYADGYQWEGASVLRSNKKAVNPKTFEVYIDSKKPFTLSDPKARDIYLNEYIKGGNSMYYDPYSDWTKAVKDLNEVDWTEGEDLRAWLKENHPEYDALYLDEGGDGGYGEAEYKWRGKSLIPFESNQIKDINNLAPTDAPSIMASRMAPDELDLGRALADQDLLVNNAPETAAVIAGKNRSWDELYDMLSRDAGAFENEDRTPITASPSQLRSEIQAIDAKYPNDLPDDIWDKRYDLNQQLKAAEKGYNSPYDYYVGESKKNFRQDFESRPDKYKAKIADIERQAQRQAALDQDIANASPRKLAQFNLIQQKNPAPNETLTWIRSPKDILTWDEAIAGAEGDNAFTWPDYTLEDALRDQKKHSMTVYSSYPIKGGTFVTPSRQQASDYAGGGRVYSKVIRPDDVAWINGDEGQYAYTKVKSLEKSLSASDRAINDADIMESRIAPGQLGLFDDMPTQTPKTGARQTSLFDQPQEGLDYYGEDIEAPVTTLANPYAPVDGQVTQAMRDRASEIIDNLALKRQIPDNELFNRIDPATLPKGQQKIGEFLDQAYSKGLTHGDITDMMRETVSSEFDKRLGKTPNKEKLISFIFGNADETAKKEMMDKELGLYIAPETVSEGTLSSMARHKISSEIYGDNLSALVAGDRTLRGGYTGALDSVLSERLGIAPGNTYKKTGAYDTGGSYGRYQEYRSSPNKNNIMVRTALDNEDAVNTMAHERLHSFQTEAKKLYDQDRYSPEVKDAYDELAKDLKSAKAYRTGDEIKKRYGRDVAYWRHHDEQEARMLQQYLDAKGYTGSNHHNENRYLGLEYDDAKITPAFDKFFDKLRDLSKRGVALPALTALFGGGAYMASQQKDKEEVK